MDGWFLIECMDSETDSSEKAFDLVAKVSQLLSNSN